MIASEAVTRNKNELPSNHEDERHIRRGRLHLEPPRTGASRPSIDIFTIRELSRAGSQRCGFGRCGFGRSTDSSAALRLRLLARPGKSAGIRRSSTLYIWLLLLLYKPRQGRSATQIREVGVRTHLFHGR